MVQQRHGETVVVPPGTVHTVINLAACVKLAVETASPGHLCLYNQSLFVHNNEFFGELNAKEYMQLASVTVRTATCITKAWKEWHAPPLRDRSQKRKA